MIRFLLGLVFRRQASIQTPEGGWNVLPCSGGLPFGPW